MLGNMTRMGRSLNHIKNIRRFLPTLNDMMIYMDLLRDDLDLLHVSVTRKILEIQRCPKCGKEFTEYPALSCEDNETEICSECGVREAVEACQKATQ